MRKYKLDEIYTADMTAAQIAQEALKIASDICVYTNGEIVVETL